MTSVLKTIVTIAYIIICVALVIVVLMQEGKTNGLGAMTGAADTYWTKNKGRSTEGVLVKITTVLSVLFVALSLILCTNWLD
ncbi:MAG: preprotein translocase subunit SecG [Eubacterium sp.]|jgi:protein translocase, SecG subunit|nr:preprotein translocase subunit SecG [Eubacterium sp.]